MYLTFMQLVNSRHYYFCHFAAWRPWWLTSTAMMPSALSTFRFSQLWKRWHRIVSQNPVTVSQMRHTVVIGDNILVQSTFFSYFKSIFEINFKSNRFQLKSLNINLGHKPFNSNLKEPVLTPPLSQQLPSTKAASLCWTARRRSSRAAATPTSTSSCAGRAGKEQRESGMTK